MYYTYITSIMHACNYTPKCVHTHTCTHITLHLHNIYYKNTESILKNFPVIHIKEYCRLPV